MLLAADVAALLVAFAAAARLAGTSPGAREWLVVLGLLPIWIVMAKLYGLYDRDEERADHSTVDDFVGVFHVVTVGAWLLSRQLARSAPDDPSLGELASSGRSRFRASLAARDRRARPEPAERRSTLQNTVIVGAGDVGQLVARKVLQHPEYGINLVGFVDDDPRTRRAELDAHAAPRAERLAARDHAHASTSTA